MKAAIIADNDYQTELFQKLHKLVVTILNDKGFASEEMNIGSDSLAFCMGCFGCWVKKPGECVINDMMALVNQNYANSDVVVYLSPVIFGQFSANIKNAIDRWIPNILPFFATRPDGSTVHPSRYELFPRRVIIGYGDELSEDDVQLFIDINKKHLTNAEVLIYQGTDRPIAEALSKMELRRAGGYI